MDKLFLLKHDFVDAPLEPQGRVYYCPSCAAIEGVLSYYPFLRERLEVVYVDFPKPRKEIVDLIGEAHQGCPVLVIDEDRGDVKIASSVKESNGKMFLNSTEQIMHYMAVVHDVGFPHP